ncbi:hypothetical protein B0A53_05300 [Rhodotorula sp. CCFEE 5036]|nr:hypothetical protein B0A53_05300 [Rhodotorula sp. CCFEE 5036]
MSDHGSRAGDSRSERAGSVHSSHYSHDSSRTKDPVDPQEAERRRRDADREFERNRDRERDRERERRYRGDDRSDRGDRRRRGGDYPPPDDDDDERDHPRAHKRRRSASRDDPRPSSRHYDDYYYDNRGHRDGGGGRRDHRGRDRDYDRRPSRREPSYEPPRSRRSPSYEPPRMARSPSPQLSEEQREMRSVFVSQLAARVTDRELGIFFEKLAGKVRDARVIVDRITRRSKGVGYVEFVDLETVQKALTLSGTKLLGIPIQVQYTEAEKNRQARDGSSSGSGSGGLMTGGLYVGSLNFALTSDDLREVFQPFGELETVELHRDPVTGKSKGYCFVKFKRHEDAMTAIEKMNNFQLAGREIKVGLVADRSATFNKHLSGQQGGGGAGAGGGEALEREEGHTGKLDANTRADLMAKLARTDRPLELPPTPMYRPNIPQNLTRNVLLKNAFNPAEETERDWDLELADDVKTECEEKYGKVLDIYGEIYIRFDSVETAARALQGLNGRWFGGKQISAAHVGDTLYDSNK